MTVNHTIRPKKSAAADSRTKILSGWKDIANYLRKGVRTVQRYERKLHLPVHRPSGRTCGAVVCFSIELDDWVSESPKTTAPPNPAGSGSQRVDGLKRGILEMHGLLAEGGRLTEIVTTQGTSVHYAIERVVRSLSGPAFLLKTERHKTIAAQQKASAADMIHRAREMSERAIEMRRPSHRRLILTS